jgi:hypothetical protein
MMTGTTPNNQLRGGQWRIQIIKSSSLASSHGNGSKVEQLCRLAWRSAKALPTGRRLCVAAVGVDKPPSPAYVKTNRRWLIEAGFIEITKSSRQAAMLIAENLDTVKAWLADLSVRRQPIEHPACVWRALDPRQLANRIGGRARASTSQRPERLKSM